MSIFSRKKDPFPEVIDANGKDLSASYSLAKVFAYMFLWLGITAVVATPLGILINYLANSDVNGEFFLAYLGLIVAASIAVLVLTIVIQVKFLKKGKFTVPLAVIYAVLMGVMCSTYAVIIDGYLIGVSFGITSLIFGIMALIGVTAKKRLTGLAIAGMGLMFGALVMSGFMLIIMFFFPSFYQPYYWIISLAILCGVILTTIYDISRIKELAQKGALNKNLSLYLSFNLYVDFMYILIRIMELVAKVTGNSSR